MIIDHKYTDNIICPYCGSEDEDSWEVGSGGEEDAEQYCCGSCEKEFRYSRHISVSYSTSTDCSLNDEEHDWVLYQEHPKFDYVNCSKCDIDEFNEHPVTGEKLWEISSGNPRVLQSLETLPTSEAESES